MSCSGNSKSYQKSCVRYFNNSPQTLAANAATVLTLAGAKVVNSGESIQVEPQSYDTVKIGLYHLVADAVITSSAAGVLTLQWYMDGVALPCTLRKVTLRKSYIYAGGDDRCNGGRQRGRTLHRSAQACLAYDGENQGL